MQQRHQNGYRRPLPQAPARHHSLPPLKRPHEMTVEGKIEFFDPVRGFGFIEAKDGTKIFLHTRVVREYDVPDRLLAPGTPVRCLTADLGRKKPEATAIAIA